MKEEALKLADWLDKSISADDFGEMAKYYQWCQKNVSPMIRRLVEELDKWEKDLHLQSHVLGLMEGKAAQVEEYMMLQQPLSDEEIEELREYHGINDWLYETSVIDFARAIEERYGIK